MVKLKFEGFLSKKPGKFNGDIIGVARGWGGGGLSELILFSLGESLVTI